MAAAAGLAPQTEAQMDAQSLPVLSSLHLPEQEQGHMSAIEVFAGAYLSIGAVLCVWVMSPAHDSPDTAARKAKIYRRIGRLGFAAAVVGSWPVIISMAIIDAFKDRAKPKASTGSSIS
jgi:hypothetical protein